MSRNNFGKTFYRTAQASVLACVLAMVAAGTAEAANRVGWVWANLPSTAAPYAPDPTRAFNSVGGPIQISRPSAGVYQVRFTGLYNGAPDDVQVTAYGTNSYCMTAGWGHSGKDVLANVDCYDKAGVAANRQFTLLYQSRSAPLTSSTRALAFVWADQPTAVSTYAPSAGRQYNSTGSVNTVNHIGVGNYSVVLPKLTVTSGDVQVTAYNFGQNPAGPGGPARCKVGSWLNNADATFVNVWCFDASGKPADEYFDLAYARKVTFGFTGSANVKGAYAWANQPANPSPYVTDLKYQFNGFATGSLTAQMIAVGRYSVVIPGSLSYTTSNVIVTAYGPDSAPSSDYCNIVGWSGGTVAVNCYKQGGTLDNSQFDLAFQTEDNAAAPAK